VVQAGRDDRGGPNPPLNVVEIGGGLAAAYAGWLLLRMGASVARIGPALTSPGTGDPIALALEALGQGKTTLDASAGVERVTCLLGAADLVISDDRARLQLLTGRTVSGLADALPGKVLGIASIFGLSGPLADAPATSLDAQAVSSVSWVLGEAGREPLSLPPGIVEHQAGAHLAAASLLALRVPRPSDRARIVDIALADILASYVGVNCRFYIHHGMSWERAGRRASGSGGAYPFVILPCQDGDVCLSGRTRDEWNRFVKAMGDPAWAAEPRYQNLRAMGQQYPDEVDALVLPWLCERTKAEIGELASRFKLTISPLRTFEEVLVTPQFAERSFLEERTVSGRAVRTAGLPFKVSDERSPPAADLSATLLTAMCLPRASQAADETKPLSGLRVLDLGWVWSAPQVGSFLAQLGAEVTKVEHGQRPDNARLSGRVFKDGQKVEGDTTEMSPMFHQINRGKLGITLNMKQPRAVELARELARRSDIVIENMSPGAIDRSGLGYNEVRQGNDRIIMLAMSGAGQYGPLAEMRTYAPVMSSFVGLETLVGYTGERPLGALNFALGDPNAAIHGLLAVIAALHRRDVTGQGCYIDLSQTEALLGTLTPYLLLAQISGQQPLPSGNAHPTQAPHGIYPAEGQDRWLTIAVENDTEWAALARLAPGQSWASADRYAKEAGRIADRATLDSALASWTRCQGPGRTRPDLARSRDRLVGCPVHRRAVGRPESRGTGHARSGRAALHGRGVPLPRALALLRFRGTTRRARPASWRAQRQHPSREARARRD
jgi:crotonobetainyl-CoA:carnitine CoA-transferase CaiB-like acyl-CoA transferase